MRVSKRLSVFAPSAYPLGGVADWLDYVLFGLRESGFEVTLCLTAGCGHDVDRYLSRHPWPTVRVLVNSTGSAEGRIRTLMAAIRVATPDLVLSVNLFDVYEAVRRLRFSGTRGAPRVVMALHGLQADLIDDIRENADLLDGVVATNRLSAALAATAFGQADRVHYAPYGVPEAVPRQAVPLCGTRLRLLYAGRVEQEQKRVLDLPAIVAALRARGVDARLSIAGVGPDEGLLRSAAEAIGSSDAIEWLGDLDRARLTKAYASHDALVITSVWETGPIVAWEAMSFGLPVASSRYVGSGLEGALVDGRTAMLFEIGDIDGAVEALIRLRDPAARATVVSGAHELVMARYSRQHSIAAWRDAAMRVLESAPRSPAPPRLTPPCGRLDRWLGASTAETVRSVLGRRFQHSSPGAAWPHTGCTTADQQAFLARARQGDQAGHSIAKQAAFS